MICTRLLPLFLVLGVHAAVDVTVKPSVPGENLIANGSFEQVGPDGVPAGWAWSQNNTDGTLQVVSPGRASQNAIRVTNSTPLAPHVYCRLAGPTVTVQPGELYTFSAWVRTHGKVGVAWFGGGPGWSWRMSLPDTKGEWQRVHQTFANVAETNIPTMIISESPTDAIDIDDVRLEQGGQPSPSPNEDGELAPLLTLEIASTRSTADQPQLVAATWADYYPANAWAFGEGELQLAGVLSLPRAAERAHLELDFVSDQQVIGSYRGTGQPALPPYGMLTVRADLPPLADGELIVRARAVTPDEVLIEREFALHVVSAAGVRSLLRDVAAPLAALYGKAKNDDDALVVATTIDWFRRWVEEDLDAGLVDRAYDQAVRLRPMAAAALADPTRPRAPRYVTSPLTIRDGSFWGQVRRSDGQLRQQPVFFAGMGHFGSVRSMVGEFPRVGFNIIQIEIGPTAVMPDETTLDNAALDALIEVMDRAARANVLVNVLFSPHYFPAWAFAKWPELRNFNGGFLQFDVNHPEARALIDRFLRHVVPRLASHPALHSLCLTNEPIAIDQSGSLVARGRWQAWLRERFETIGQLNARWSSDYTSFDQITIPPTAFEATARCIDYIRFNQENFAGWHRWMADVIHEMAPQVPVHAKIMIGAHFDLLHQGFWGVAPELFSELSQINGNDAYKFAPANGEWACDWLNENMGYDYQRSAKLAPVFNSENHFIPDRSHYEVSPEFVRNVLWQGAVHGQGATTTWVWERTTDVKSDFSGSIMHRPECVASYGRTTLDLNRAAAELHAVSSAPAPIAVVWSQAAAVYNSAHVWQTRHAYTAANFMDRQVGFINERDAEAYLAGQANAAFDHAKIILAAGLTHTTPALLAALDRFEQRGGRVLWLDGLPEFDDAGRPLTDQPARTARVADAASRAAKDLAAALAPQVLAACGPALVPVGQWGVEARAARLGAARVVNLCNYLRTPVTVQLPPGVDVLTGRATGGRVELQPLVPRIIRLR